MQWQTTTLATHTLQVPPHPTWSHMARLYSRKGRVLSPNIIRRITEATFDYKGEQLGQKAHQTSPHTLSPQFGPLRGVKQSE